VWVLGDIAVADLDGALEKIQALPGTKHLISGNHDPSHPMHRKAAASQKRMLTAFDSVQPFARRRIDGEDVLLSHFPYNGPGGDRGEIRYPQWRLPDLGAWLLHGHTHMEDQRRHGKQIHVGVDAWDLTPVPVGTITELMKEEESWTKDDC
jgi:calcineurin-like phosphoesterase family protein